MLIFYIKTFTNFEFPYQFTTIGRLVQYSLLLYPLELIFRARFVIMKGNYSSIKRIILWKSIKLYRNLDFVSFSMDSKQSAWYVMSPGVIILSSSMSAAFEINSSKVTMNEIYFRLSLFRNENDQRRRLKCKKPKNLSGNSDFIA